MNGIHWDRPWRGSGEASEVGFPVGRWPDDFTHDGARFVRVKTERDRDGDVTAVVYRDDRERTITVFND